LRVSSKIQLRGLSTSDRGLSERRTSEQEMDVNVMQEEEINDIVVEEVSMEDMD
jgi:hypothetical protein